MKRKKLDVPIVNTSYYGSIKPSNSCLDDFETTSSKFLRLIKEHITIDPTTISFQNT